MNETKIPRTRKPGQFHVYAIDTQGNESFVSSHYKPEIAQKKADTLQKASESSTYNVRNVPATLPPKNPRKARTSETTTNGVDLATLAPAGITEPDCCDHK